MSAAEFVHDGAAIDHTPDADLASGEIVVQGELVGITKRDIKANMLGSIAVEGVFDVPERSCRRDCLHRRPEGLRRRQQ